MGGFREFDVPVLDHRRSAMDGPVKEAVRAWG
jgi:hypothetical protein